MAKEFGKFVYIEAKKISLQLDEFFQIFFKIQRFDNFTKNFSSKTYWDTL